MMRISITDENKGALESAHSSLILFCDTPLAPLFDPISSILISQPLPSYPFLSLFPFPLSLALVFHPLCLHGLQSFTPDPNSPLGARFSSDIMHFTYFTTFIYTFFLPRT